MKKLIKPAALLLAVVMMLALASCSGTKAKKIESAADLVAGVKVGVQQGTTGDTYASEEIEGLQVERFSKAVDVATDLKNGKLDAVIIDDVVAENLVASIPGLKILPETLTDEEYAMAVQKGNEELLSDINAKLKEMTEDGTIEKIKKAYIAKDEEALKELAELPEPAGDKELVVGTNAAFEPFEYKNDAGDFDGYDMVVVKELARRMGMSLKIEDMEFGVLLGSLATGKCDLVAAAVTVTDERKKTVDFTDSYYKAAQVIIVKE